VQTDRQSHDQRAGRAPDIAGKLKALDQVHGGALLRRAAPRRSPHLAAPPRPPGRSKHTAFLVGEQGDIPGGPADNPVGQQRVAAAEGEPVPGRRAQRDAGHLGVQRTGRHQADAAAAGRSTG